MKIFYFMWIVCFLPTIVYAETRWVDSISLNPEGTWHFQKCTDYWITNTCEANFQTKFNREMTSPIYLGDALHLRDQEGNPYTFKVASIEFDKAEKDLHFKWGKDEFFVKKGDMTCTLYETKKPVNKNYLSSVVIKNCDLIH